MVDANSPSASPYVFQSARMDKVTCFFPDPDAVQWWLRSSCVWTPTSPCIAAWAHDAGFTVMLGRWSDVVRMIQEDEDGAA